LLESGYNDIWPANISIVGIIHLPNVFLQIGSVCALFLVGSVGSHFSPTYAALVTSTMAAIIGPTLLLIFAFNLHSITTNVDWIFWETIYSGSFAFLFLINSITMIYSSLRWQYTAWWLGTVCTLLCSSCRLSSNAGLRRERSRRGGLIDAAFTASILRNVTCALVGLAFLID
uniref:DUF4203 domain-containing protein n=1 Tax=Haemonchus placei TaxID=6290 RepID=A0A0N4VXL8_HAEPC